MQPKQTTFLLALSPMPAFAEAGDSNEPAVIILLILGMVALIAGLSSLGELRRKTLVPPRPAKRPKVQPAETNEDDDEQQPLPGA